MLAEELKTAIFELATTFERVSAEQRDLVNRYNEAMAADEPPLEDEQAKMRIALHVKEAEMIDAMGELNKAKRDINKKYEA